MKNILIILVLIFGINTNLHSQTNLTTAIDFTVTDFNGNTINLFSILDSGQWVLINFGAYWCGPCMTLAPDFGQAYEDFGCNNGDIFLLEVEYQGTNAQCQDFLTQYGAGHDVPYVCGAEQLTLDWGIAAFPSNVLINPDGDIVLQDIWPIDYTIISNTLNYYGINPGNCNTTTSVEEVEIQTITDNRLYDMLGREWPNYESLPYGFYIKNGKKFIKTK